MAAASTTNQRVIVPCENDRCAVYLVLGPDDDIPKSWYCPRCADELYTQELASYHTQPTEQEQTNERH